MRSKSERLYTRNGRYYADLRDLGGGRVALRPEGAHFATSSKDLAEDLVAQMVRELTGTGLTPESDDDGVQLMEPQDDPAPSTSKQTDMRWDAYCRRHLRVLGSSEGRAKSTVQRAERSLRWFRKFLVEQGHGDIRLAEIDVRMVTDFKEWRAGHPGVKPGTTLADQTLRNDVYALSGVLRRAWEEEIIEQNPVNRTRFKTKVERPPTYLEITEGAALLQVARWFDLYPSGRSVPFLEALIGSMMIEGLRIGEASSLRVGDIDLEAGILGVGRRPKTNASLRDVPLWPQFRQMVEPLLEQRRSEGDDALLFPSPDTGGVLTDIRGSLETAVEAAGIEKHITCHSLRHTYASVRIQTLEQGHPVPLFTVAREMGHTSIQLIEQRYGHILKNPRRLPHVAFDFEDPEEDE